MKNQVKIVAHPETKAVVTKNVNKPEYGTIRVDQEGVSMENGFLNKTRRTAFIHGKLIDLESFGFEEGQLIPGKIVRKESFEPFYDGQSAKINPTTKELVLVNGSKVYMQDTFTSDLSAQDSLLKSTEVENANIVSDESMSLNG